MYDYITHLIYFIIELFSAPINLVLAIFGLGKHSLLFGVNWQVYREYPKLKQKVEQKNKERIDSRINNEFMAKTLSKNALESIDGKDI